MYEDMEVKYLFIDLKYPAYIKLQKFLIVGLVAAGIFCFLFTRGSERWLFNNGWWFFPVVAILEVLESLVAVNKAKKNYVPPTKRF